MSALLLKKCCCKKGGPCKACNSCPSDYSNDGVGCLPKAVTLTISDFSLDDRDLSYIDPEERTDYTCETAITLKSVSGTINGDYVLHQTSGGYLTVIDASPVEFEIQIPGSPPADPYIELLSYYLTIAVTYAGAVTVILSADYVNLEEVDDGVIKLGCFSLPLFYAQFDLEDEISIRCKRLETTDATTSYIVSDEVPTFSSTGTVALAVCGGDPSSDYTPPADDDLIEMPSAWQVFGGTVTIKSGETVVKSCALNRVMTAGTVPRYDDYPELPVNRITNEWGENGNPKPETPITSPDWCNYVTQAKLTLESNKWTLVVGPKDSVSVALEKTNSYGALGKYSAPITTIYDAAIGYTLEFDLRSVTVQ